MAGNFGIFLGGVFGEKSCISEYVLSVFKLLYVSRADLAGNLLDGP